MFASGPSHIVTGRAGETVRARRVGSAAVAAWAPRAALSSDPCRCAARAFAVVVSRVLRSPAYSQDFRLNRTSIPVPIASMITQTTG